MSQLMEIEFVIENNQIDKFKEILLATKHEEYELILYIIIAYEHSRVNFIQPCMDAINRCNNTDKSAECIYNDILQWLICRGEIEHIKIMTHLKPYPVTLKTVGFATEIHVKNLNNTACKQIYDIIYDLFIEQKR